MKLTCSYPASFAEGDSGWAVEVLQKNVNAWRWAEDDLNGNLREDGVFGGQSERAVRTLQRRRSLLVDGIAGPRTQTRLGLDLMTPFAQETGIPRCVLRGLTALESGFFVAAVNCQSDGGKDCGWCQERVSDGSDPQRYRDAFFGPKCFLKLAQTLAKRQRELGELDWAILSWNWPAAAARYADGTIDTWTYTSREKKYKMGEAAPWVIERDVDGVVTGFDWADWYVSQVKKFC